MKEKILDEAPIEYYRKNVEYIKAMGRVPSNNPEENLDIYPERDWFLNKNYEKKIEILTEAINKKCLIRNTKGYADIVEGVKIVTNKEINNILPIGTVVMLKGGTKRVMIIGFGAIQKTNKDKMWDYSGCLYPEGFLASNQTCLFDHNQIEKIYHLGLADDEEEKKFKKTLNEISNIANEKLKKQKEEN